MIIDSNFKNELNIFGFSYFGKFIKNLKNYGVECRCWVGDIYEERNFLLYFYFIVN